MKWLAQLSKFFILWAMVLPFGQSAPMALQRAVLRQSFDLQVPWVPLPVKVLGTRYLVYELHLTNFAPRELALSRIEIIEAKSGAVLDDFRGAQLQGLVGRIDDPVAKEPKLLIPAGVRAIAFLSVPMTHAGAAPQTLKHRIEYDDMQGAGSEYAIVEGGAFTVRDLHPLSLGPPLSGRPWVAVYGPDWDRGHRRVLYAVNGTVHIPGRFAIDWMKLDERGRLAVGDVDKVANWYGYGAKVLAVADAVVAAATDDLAERSSVSTHSKIPLENDSGNYVTLNLGDGRYVFYEHLKPGSIKVKPGDHVRRGETIGLLGATGETAGPHLHFHVSDANATLDAEGAPYALHNFKLLGAFASIKVFGKGERWSSLPAGTEAKRSEELPAPLAVVEFPTEVAQH